MAGPRVRPLLVAAMDARFRGVATKVLRDGALRFEGEGYDRALAEVHPLARAEYDAVRRHVAPSP